MDVGLIKVKSMETHSEECYEIYSILHVQTGLKWCRKDQTLEGKQHFTHGVQLKIVTVIRIIKTLLYFHCLESNSDFLTVGMIYSSFWLQHDFLSQSTLNSDFSATSTSWNSVRYSQCRVSTVSLCQIALILSINSNGKKNLISEILNCLLAGMKS